MTTSAPFPIAETRALQSWTDFIRLAKIVLAGVAACVATPAWAIVDALSSPIGSALDGEAELSVFWSTGGGAGCSGSLLAGGAYGLTAGHCVTGAYGNLTASTISISFKGGAITVSSTQYYVDPGWRQNPGNLDLGDDMAIIQLSSPITAVTGYTLDTQTIAPETSVLIGGYGLTGVGATGYVSGTFGTLHYGYNQYDAPQSFYKQVDVSSSVFLYDFDNGTSADSVFGSDGLGGEETMIAPGDSGGGSFVNVNGTWELVATHSFIGCLTLGCTPNSSFGQLGGDVSVAANLSWIESIDPAAAPEPGTYMLLGIGFAGLALVRREGRPFNRAPFGTPAGRA